MKLKLALASTLLITLMTGCGGSDGDPDTGFTGGKNCPQSMIDARNEVSYDCRAASSSFATRSDLNTCINSLRSFLDENPNVYCRARDLSQGGDTYVDSEELRRLLENLESI